MNRKTLSAVAAFAAIWLLGCGEPSGEPMRVHVPPGASFSQIADTLSTRGVIRGKAAFKIFARVTGNASKAKPGTYGFRRNESWGRVLEDLREANTLKAKFVIPEGWSLDRIAARIAAMTEGDSARILDQLVDSAFTAKFGVPGPTLEGYLYPATYEVSVDIPLDSLVHRLVGRYRTAWDAERQAKAQQLGMSEREVVTLASIVEKEAKRREEMPLIASVYHNRLRIGMPLQADPTVQYALGGHRTRLMFSDIRSAAENPYSTYANRGLPPGPIGSPSEAALDATLAPDTTKFLYFVARDDGSHVFTRTLDEHNRARRAVRVNRPPAAAQPPR